MCIKRVYVSCILTPFIQADDRRRRVKRISCTKNAPETYHIYIYRLSKEEERKKKHLWYLMFRPSTRIYPSIYVYIWLCM